LADRQSTKFSLAVLQRSGVSGVARHVAFLRARLAAIIQPMDITTLIATWDFSRARLLGTLDAIEKHAGADINKVLAWRPGPGRAHMAWQFVHCAATHHKYVNLYINGVSPKDEPLVANFGGGSTPSDVNVPTIAEIRDVLKRTYEEAKGVVSKLKPADLERSFTQANGATRRIDESLVLLAWHEAHHQGQIHLTFNLYKAGTRES
jgi:hypothetical protein